MPHSCIVKLQQLYQQRKDCKSRKVCTDKAHQIFLTEIIPNDWYGQRIVTVATIKAFFSLTLKKMDDMSQATSSEEEDQHFVEQIDQEELVSVVEEEENEAMGLEKYAGGDWELTLQCTNL
jgi:hypothetical protein